jgi:hypothetical protein
MGTASDRRTSASICDKHDEEGSSGGSRTSVIEFSTEAQTNQPKPTHANGHKKLTIPSAHMLGQSNRRHLHNIRNIRRLAKHARLPQRLQHARFA